MEQETTSLRRPRNLIVLAGVVTILIFLFFYPPFEAWLVEKVPSIRFDNVVFWFASLVGVVGYAIAHWRSFVTGIVRTATDLDAETLVFDTLQIAILVAVIFSAGATLQAVEILAEHLMNRGHIIDPVFGEKVLSIILLVLLAILFFLLHRVVRAFKVGWQTRQPPRRTSSSQGAPR